ncbi:MAG: dienelactone hydrolase family protein, partial [Chloroflexota bacterium]|nr:dienelactone hydrolase family protein [Chloroflexota bacterium]
MCYDTDARPPLPPVRGSALDARALTLTAVDGTRLAAYAARAANPSGAGIVVCPDVRGLHPFYEELALRFAEAGVDAVAFDYFGRTAPERERGESFDYQTHVAQTEYE